MAGWDVGAPAFGSGTIGMSTQSVYLRGIDNTEIVHAVHERPAPMIPATHGL